MKAVLFKRWQYRVISALLAVTLTVSLVQPAIAGGNVGDPASELSGGSDNGSVSHSVYESVYESVYTPILNTQLTVTPPPKAVNEDGFVLTGQTEPGLEVQVSIKKGTYNWQVIGNAVSDSNGAFGVEVGNFTDTGLYKLRAIVYSEGTPVAWSDDYYITVDYLDPPAPSGEWTTLGSDQINLSWGFFGGGGGDDTVKYLLYRDGKLLLDTGDLGTVSYSDDDVEELKAYKYEIYAVDEAGNRSQPEVLYAGTGKRDQIHVSAAEDGGMANGNSDWSAISGDGRKVVFLSEATDIIPGTGNRWTGTLYVRNLEDHSIEEIQFPADMASGVNLIRSPVMNVDGSVIAFHAEVEDQYYVFIKDSTSDTAYPIRGLDGELPNSFSSAPSISDDGEQIVFESSATNLSPDATDGMIHIFVYSRSSKTLRTVPIPDSINFGLGSEISGNGKTVLFLGGCGECWKELYAYDLDGTGAAQALVETRREEKGISSDGRYVVYRNEDSIHLYDRSTGVDRPILEQDDRYEYSMVKISGDGKTVVAGYTDFERSTSMGYGAHGLIWLNLETGERKQVTNPATYGNAPTISRNGNKVSFQSAYTDEKQIYFRDSIFVVCPVSCTSGPVEETITKATWKGSMTLRQQVKLGTEISVKAVGIAGRQAEAVVSYRTEAGAMSRTISLTELQDTPGTYTGIFQVEPGILEITGITGKIADRDGILVPKDALGLPAAVSGGLKLTLEDAGIPMVNQALQGSRVLAWSETLKAGSQALYKGPEGVSFETALPEANDYKLILSDADGEHLAELKGISIQSGTYTERAARADIPAKLEVSVTGQDGKPLQGIPVKVTGSAGETVSVGTTGDSGLIRLRGGNVGGQVHVTVELPHPYRPLPPIPVTLEAKAVAVPVEGQIHYGTVTGQILDEAGDPVAKAEVTAHQFGIPYKIKSDETGTYRLSVPEGEARITAASTGYPVLRSDGRTVVPIEAGKEQLLNITLKAVKQLTVHVDFYTKSANSSWVRQDWDATTSWAFPPYVTDEQGKYVSYAYSEQNTLALLGVPGETYRVCVKDRKERYTQDCKDVTAGEDLQANAEFRLIEAAAATGYLKNVPDKSYTKLVMYEVREDGSRGKEAGSYPLNGGGKFRVTLPKSGKYIGVFSALNWEAQYSAVRSFEVGESGLADLGTIELEKQGAFNQGANNGLTVLDQPVADKGRVTLRGHYQNGSYYSLLEPVLLLTVPAGTKLVPNSVVVNGLPVEPESGSEGAAQAEIRLPGSLSYEQSGTVQVQLEILDTSKEFLNASLDIRFKDSHNGSVHTETIGSTYIQIVPVSMTAPATVITNSFMVSGRAIPSSQVLIYDGEKVAAQTASSPSGFWTAEITLDESQAEGDLHKLTARTVSGEKSWESKGAIVRADTNRPAPLDIQMTLGGRTINADLTNGVARVPIALNPNKAVAFSIRFNRPEKIVNPAVHVGGERIPLTQNQETGRFEGIKTTYHKDLGAISLSYDIKPEPYVPVTTVEEMLKTMPQSFRYLKTEVLDDSLSEKVFSDTAMAAEGRIYAKSVLISDDRYPGEQIGVRFFHKPLPEDYNPGPKPKDGPELYQLKMTVDSSGQNMEVSAVVPKAKAEEILKQQGVVQPLYETVGYVEVGSRFKLDLKTPGSPSALGLLGTLVGAYDFYNKLNQLEDFMNTVDNADCMSPRSNKHYHDQLEKLFQDLKNNMAMKLAMQTYAMAMAALGITAIGGAILVATSMAINAAFNNIWENDFDQLKQTFAAHQNSDECDRNDDNIDDNNHPDRPDDPSYPPRRDPDRPDDILDPDWIYDPSGYVYEAVESNRLTGVTATAMTRDSGTGEWKSWDAKYYGQQNPMDTDGEGRYGWDVPEGQWQVVYSKEGYQPAKSEELTVLPPHFDVNVGMVSYTAPVVESVLQESGGTGLRLRFSKYMLPETVSAIHAVTVAPVGGDEDAAAIPLVITPVDPETSPAGVPLTKDFRITPAEGSTLVPGQSYILKVDSMVLSYAGSAMQDSYTGTFVISDSGVFEEAAEHVRVIPSETALGILWSEKAVPGLDHLKVEWRTAGAAEGAGSLVVEPGTGAAYLTVLTPGTAYEMKVKSVSVTGVESAGVTVGGTTLAAPAQVEDLPPGSVKDPALAAAEGGLRITWTDPSDPDLMLVHLSLKGPNDADFGPKVSVPKGTGSYLFETPTGYGLYQVKLEAEDLTGQLSDPVITDLELSDPVPKPVTNGAVKVENGGFTVTWTDPVSTGLQGIIVSVKKPGETVFTEMVTIGPGVQQALLSGMTAVGAYEVKLEAVGANGVRSEAVILHAVVEDTTPPVTAFKINPIYSSNGRYFSGLQIVLSASDSGSGVSKTEYRINGGAWTTYTAPLNCPAATTLKVEFRSWDKAGNKERTHVMDFVQGAYYRTD